MQPMFTNNDSEIGRLEQLYIRERRSPGLVRGVFLGVVCVVAECLRGPVETPIEITSRERLIDVFGGRDLTGGGPILSRLWTFFLNKRFGKIVVVRVKATGAAASTLNLSDANPTVIARVDAASVGAWGNLVTVAVQNATDGVNNHWNLVVKYLGKTVVIRNLDTTANHDNTLARIPFDESNWITLTKVADGRPANSGDTALANGADGTPVDADYTGTGKALEIAAAAQGAGIVTVAERFSNAIKTKMYSLSATTFDRLWIMGAADETVNKSTAITDVANFRSDRVIYAFNHAQTLDGDSAQNVYTHPAGWMASILANTDVDIHPGDSDNTVLTQAITALAFKGLQREDYISLREAGIAALERDDGYSFVSGVTTSLDDGLTQITRRRMADYILLSLTTSLKKSVKKKNTQTRRATNGGIVKSFLEPLKKAERVVEDYEVPDPDSVNTQQSRAAGNERLVIRVSLIKHILSLILDAEIGTDTVIIRQAQ